MQHTGNVHTAAGGIDAVMARFDAFHFPEYASQAGRLLHDAPGKDAVTDVSGFHTGIYVKVHLSGKIGNLAVVIIGIGVEAPAQERHGQYPYSQNLPKLFHSISAV
jgi:hypothetical protein